MVYDGHMTQASRLSTCYHCGGTIERRDVPAGSGVSTFRQHVTPPKVEHAAEPDDGAVSGPADDERGDDYFGDERGSTAKLEDES